MDLTEANLDQFTITFRREIVFYLRQLANTSERLTITFDEGRETLLSMILDVDDEEGTMIFDWGGSEASNRRFLESERNFFVATPHGVRNQFVVGRPWQVTYDGRPAFAAALPEKYVRMQRREFFRQTLPVTRRPPCRIKHPNAKNDLEFAVVDIGIGGAGLEGPSVSAEFTLGQRLPAMIDLAKFGVFRVELEIRYSGHIERGSRHLLRLGCHFDGLTHAQEQVLQRYITQVQRDERFLHEG